MSFGTPSLNFVRHTVLIFCTRYHEQKQMTFRCQNHTFLSEMNLFSKNVKKYGKV